GVCDVNAGLLDGAEVEGLRVDELHDENAEEVGVAEIGRGDLRETAEEVVQRGGLRLRRVVGGEELEDGLVDALFALVDDRITAAVDEDVRRNHAGKRNDLAGEFQRVGHGERVGVAWHGDDVFGREDGGLLEDAPTYFGEGEAVLGRVEVREASGLLDGLEGDAADTRLREREVDDCA